MSIDPCEQQQAASTGHGSLRSESRTGRAFRRLDLLAKSLALSVLDCWLHPPSVRWNWDQAALTGSALCGKAGNCYETITAIATVEGWRDLLAVEKQGRGKLLPRLKAEKEVTVEEETPQKIEEIGQPTIWKQYSFPLLLLESTSLLLADQVATCVDLLLLSRHLLFGVE